MHSGVNTRRATLTTLLSVLALAASWGGRANAQEPPGLLSSADVAIPIDLDATFVPGTGWVGSSSPPGEEAPFAVDQFENAQGQRSTKYLNSGGERSGLIITNSDGPVQANFMRIWTANDFPERDPASYELYGTNDPISSQPHSSSNGTEVWTLLSGGPLSLPDARFSPDDFITIFPPSTYTHYRLIFPTLKDAAAANNLMQIADVQLYTVIPEPAGLAPAALAAAALTLGCARPRRGRH